MAPKERLGSWHAYDVAVERDTMIPVRDGVRLATDIYFPSSVGLRAPGRFPALVERTPYDKDAARFVLPARFFAQHGYVVLMQDVRGRGHSEGDWYPFAHEAPDGYDTIEWAGTQPWCTGKVGTMGHFIHGSGAERRRDAQSAPSGRDVRDRGTIGLLLMLDAAQRCAGAAFPHLCLSYGDHQ